MSETEQRLADTPGQFTQVVREGRTIEDADWTEGRILLSNKRLILASSEGKRTIGLSAIDAVADRYDVNDRIEKVADYLSLRFADNVLLIAAQDTDGLLNGLFQAVLDEAAVLVRHPAIRDGTVQDTDWEKAELTLGDKQVAVATEGEELIEIRFETVTDVDSTERTVREHDRQVVEVECTEEDTSVSTYLSGADQRCAFLESLFQSHVSESKDSFEPTQVDKQVLAALYSGVSSFEIPGFTGLPVDDVEETFDRLIELGVLEEVRTRREVALTSEGRNLASEAINED